MNTKRVGWAYLWMTATFVIASLFVSYFMPYMGISITALLSELCLLIPVLCFLIRGRAQIPAQLKFRGIKPATVLLVLVYHICCYPLVIAMNSFTMVISDNEALDLTAQFQGEPFFLIWLFVGLVGPVVEELIFRGAILGGLRTTGRIFTPILLSALLFGLIHMNVNQFSYTLCMGIFWGLLAEATGSIIPSMICHITMNSVSVILAYLLEDSIGGLEEIIEAGGAGAALSYAATGFTFLFISIFTTMLAMLMLRVISLNEGRTGCFENIFRQKSKAERYGHLFSIPLIIGIAIAAVVTITMLIADFMN